MKATSKMAKSRGFIVPPNVFDFDVSPTAKLVYILLCKMANNDSRQSWPGKRYIAKQCGISPRTVFTVLDELRQAGLITITPRFDRGHQKTNIYTVYDEPGGAFENGTEGQETRANSAPLPVQCPHGYPCKRGTPTRANSPDGTCTNLTNNNELPRRVPRRGAARRLRHAAATPSLGQFKNIILSDDEDGKLLDKYGITAYADYVQRLSAWLEAGGHSKNHYATLCNWMARDKVEVLS